MKLVKMTETCICWLNKDH